MSTYDSGHNPARRQALSCLAAWTGAAVVWTVAGGVPRALGATTAGTPTAAAKNALTFVQISDTHIGFRKEANPDVIGSLRHAIADINALPQAPAFVVHTGDVSHLSKPEEFGKAREVLQEIRVDRVHTVPGEHDTIDEGVTGYLKFFDHDGNGKAWYSFDQGGVRFIALNNVLNFKVGTMAALGDEQITWIKSDLAHVSHSTPIVVLAHIPLWTIWEPWGWHRRFRAGDGAVASVRIGHRAQRSYPSSPAEGRRQYRAAHCDVARLPAAHTWTGGHRRARAGYSARGRTRQAARYAPAQRCARTA